MDRYEIIGYYYDRGERIELVWDHEDGEGCWWSVHQQRRLPHHDAVVVVHPGELETRPADYDEVLAEWHRWERVLAERERDRQAQLAAQ